MNKPGKQKRARIPPPENGGEKSRQFKGVRMRKGGKWVSEVRMPNSRAKIWLGSYDTAEQAARAFDAAVFCLRGPHANLNFPDTVPAVPSTASLSRQQIQVAAANYARDQIPTAAENNCRVLAENSLSLTPISSGQLPNLDKFLSLDTDTVN
ncbi:hypothetical protein SUGI_0127150 [Cryptomeria japonica]|uniref:ethylene-responsive transcription factor ERF016 n=1 Tax=Cryptomeria japonica TaxID=3369 RepID=UPI00240894C9|nr:ethylene-responsive transcription factor ERF016 [Cryptomeria japonica]GLJ10380.1 hypothetical protein SUGI_0127150 [Cryptomeria japonica]